MCLIIAFTGSWGDLVLSKINISDDIHCLSYHNKYITQNRDIFHLQDNRVLYFMQLVFISDL